MRVRRPCKMKGATPLHLANASTHCSYLESTHCSDLSSTHCSHLASTHCSHLANTTHLSLNTMAHCLCHPMREAGRGGGGGGALFAIKGWPPPHSRSGVCVTVCLGRKSLGIEGASRFIVLLLVKGFHAIHRDCCANLKAALLRAHPPRKFPLRLQRLVILTLGIHDHDEFRARRTPAVSATLTEEPLTCAHMRVTTRLSESRDRDTREFAYFHALGPARFSKSAD